MYVKQRDLLKKALKHQKSDGLLYYMDFAGSSYEKMRKHYNIPEGVDHRDYFNMISAHGVGANRVKSPKEFDFAKYYHGMDLPERAYIDGSGILIIPDTETHFVRTISPLRNCTTLEEIMEYPWEEPENFDGEGMAEQVEKIRAQNRISAIWAGRIYEQAWPIRGYEEMLMDMIAEEEIAEFIFTKIFAVTSRIAELAATAGVDMIYFGDDIGNQNDLMFSKELFLKYIKPRWAELLAKLKKISPDTALWYHSDGNITKVFGDMVEVGFDIINPIQPECMDVFEIKRLYGDKIVMDGAIGTQTVLPFGTPDDVRKAVTEAVEKLGYDGAYILGPSHVVEPEVPIENIVAFIETAQKYL